MEIQQRGSRGLGGGQGALGGSRGGQGALGVVNDISLRDRGRWHLLASAVIGVWILIGLGLVVAASLGAPVVWWDLIHPFTIGALTTAIVVYSTHFTEALTRTAASAYRWVGARVGLIQLGLVLLLIDRAGYDWSMTSDIAAACILVALVWHIVALSRRLRGSLSGSFAVTVPFYLAATAFMVIAVILAVLAGNGVADSGLADSGAAGGGGYSRLIAAHSRAAVWGFAWLTVLGTVVTLLPTLSGTPISPAARARCTRALIIHCAGLAVALAGYIIGWGLLAGLAQLLTVAAAVLLLQPIIATVLGHGPTMTTATVSVIAGLLWLIALCSGDAISTLAGAYSRAITLILAPAFIGAGLIQLVTGVLHHLLPTLLGGGPPRVLLGRRLAGIGGYARLVLINLGAAVTVLDPVGVGARAGLIMMGLGVAGHLIAIAVAITKQKNSEN